MVRFESWLFKWLLVFPIGLLFSLPVWVNSHTPEFCTSLETLKDQLNSSLRRRYLKHNFPINYTIQVRYEGVFRLSNISNISNLENDTKYRMDLQDLWFEVTDKSIKSILTVLPERHPSRHKYLKKLDSLFTLIRGIYPQRMSDELDYSESIENAFLRLQAPDDEGMKSVTPKSLLDNCYRTMHCIFTECFPRNASQDNYCSAQHWRKRNGKRG